MFVINALEFIIGLGIVVFTIFSATRTFILPRSARDPLTSLVFQTSRRLFDLFARRAKTYEGRDSIMALFAPITLMLLPQTWLVLVLVGYTFIFQGAGIEAWDRAITVSGSSLLTLGFATTDNLFETLLAFTEGIIGLVLVALLIAYLPTMYSTFSKREQAVTMLQMRAGTPPSAITMLTRYAALNNIPALSDLWSPWEQWFAELQESHTSLAPLVFFRSPQSDHSWVTAAGVILDTAALIDSTIDLQPDVKAAVCLRAGYLSLRRVADSFNIQYDPNPKSDDPISITRIEYDEACEKLIEAGVPIRADRDQAWRDFAGWRVNYDTPLLALAALTMAPEAPWSSDRSLLVRRPSRKPGKAGYKAVVKTEKQDARL